MIKPTIYLDLDCSASHLMTISALFSHDSAAAFWIGEYETGNFLELTRVDDFYISAPPVSFITIYAPTDKANYLVV